MFVAETGSGEPVVLLHGTPSPPEDFDALVAALAAKRRVLVPHMYGYGKTPALRPFALERVLAGVEEALRTRGVREAAFVGFSGGAYRAFAIALRGNVRATKIVSLGGVAGFPPEAAAPFRGIASALRSDPSARAQLRAGFPERMTMPGWPAANENAATTVASWIDATTTDVLADELDAIANGDDLHPRLASIDAPILARVGELDAASPPPASEAIAKGARNGTLEIVPKVGHALFVLDRDATIASILRFLA